MRRRASRRSVSSCDSPGPRVPMPPPRRSRCCHRPRIRGRLYSSWASSTWSFPSALRACWAKMSRMSCVRSIDARAERVLQAPLLARVELGVDDERLRLGVGELPLELLELALSDVAARVRLRPVLHETRPRARRPRCAGAPAAPPARLPRRLRAPARRRRIRARARPRARGPAGVGSRVDYAPASTAREDSIRRAASSSRSSGTVREMRTNPSPAAPNDDPGETTTAACSSTSSVKLAES